MKKEYRGTPVEFMINSAMLKRVAIIARNTVIIVLEWTESVAVYRGHCLIVNDAQEIKYAKII
jgi:hypothetical protein